MIGYPKAPGGRSEACARKIFVDTETTGLSPYGGDRICDVAALEVDDSFNVTGFFQRYVNPGRPMPRGAFLVHGLSDAFLSDKPRFADIAPDFLNFVSGAELYAHNASFDKKFLDYELRLCGEGTLEENGCRIVDTLSIARRKLYGARSCSLDALCGYFGIDTSERSVHGALTDCCLLANVTARLLGKSASIRVKDVLAFKPVLRKAEKGGAAWDFGDKSYEKKLYAVLAWAGMHPDFDTSWALSVLGQLLSKKYLTDAQKKGVDCIIKKFKITP